MLNLTKIIGIEFDGIDRADYPDFVDSYISRGFIEENGQFRELTENELEYLNEECADFKYEKLIDWLY